MRRGSLNSCSMGRMGALVKNPSFVESVPGMSLMWSASKVMRICKPEEKPFRTKPALTMQPQ